MTGAELARLAIVAFVAFWIGFSTATARLRRTLARTLRARSWNVTPPEHYNCRSILVGVAGESVRAGQPVTVALDGRFVGTPRPVCGKPRSWQEGGEGCLLERGHDGPCRATTWGGGETICSTVPATGKGGDGQVAVYTFPDGPPDGERKP